MEEMLARKGDGVTCPVAVFVRGRTVLMGLRHYTPDRWKTVSVWTLPGGRSDSGETLEETLRREVAEETGIVNFSIHAYLGSVPGAEPGDTVLLFACGTFDDAKLMEPEKFSDWKWFDPGSIPGTFINAAALELVKGYVSSFGDELDAIRARYRATLAVPLAKPPRQILVCPVGLVGAGKTTVVKPLSERLGLVRISGDELRELFKERGLSWDRNLRDMAHGLIAGFLRDGYGVTLDSDCASAETLERIARWQREFPVTIVWLHIAPPESFILKKLRKYDWTRSWLFKNADAAIANYERRKPLHEHLPMPFLYTFDTSREDLPQQLAEAERLIRNELHE